MGISEPGVPRLRVDVGELSSLTLRGSIRQTESCTIENESDACPLVEASHPDSDRLTICYGGISRPKLSEDRSVAVNTCGELYS